MKKPVSIFLGICLCLPLTLPPALSSAEERAVPASAAIDSVETRRLLFALQQQRAKLQADYEKKDQKLDLKEIELKTLQGEVDKKLAELQNVRDDLRQLLEQKDEFEVKRVKGLSKMYEKMDPVKGAALLAQLDQELAVNILAGIKAKVAGQLLANMGKEKAAGLSVAYSTLEKD